MLYFYPLLPIGTRSDVRSIEQQQHKAAIEAITQNISEHESMTCLQNIDTYI